MNRQPDRYTLQHPNTGCFFIFSLWDCPNFLPPFYAGLLGWNRFWSNMNTSPGRLLFLVSSDMDYASMMGSIWNMAAKSDLPILFLGLAGNASQEQEIHRGVTALSNLMRDGGFSVDVKIEREGNWLAVIQSLYHPGDVIVYSPNQRTNHGWQTLDQKLKSNLGTDVVVLCNTSALQHGPHHFSEAFTWLGFIGVIIGFGVLQVKIVDVSKDALQSILLILSIIPELWLLWVWNGLIQ